MSGIAQHLPILPILVPLVAGLLLLALPNSNRAAQRWVSLAGVLVALVIAVLVIRHADAGDISVYRLGNWPAPFGIVLVLDRLSAIMVALSAVVALPVWWLAIHDETDAPYFHPLLQLQLVGLNGAFLTGDLFNLFVFFEILLIASYGLLLWGARREQLRGALPYVAVNLAGSTLFLIALGLIYGIAGTLNIADLARRVGQLPASDLAIAQSAALLLAVVFGLKAALAPLHLWLPAAYGAASTPVATLFAIMTKVGVYALLRIHGGVFGTMAGDLAGFASPWLVGAALVTIVVAVASAIAAQTLRRLVAGLLVASVGVMTAAITVFEGPAVGAGLFYLLQSTLVLAALFALAGPIAARRGQTGDTLVPLVWRAPTALAVVFLLTAAAAAGLPPFPGFLGKALILRATIGHQWVWLVILAGGLGVLVAIARAGMALFWDRPAIAAVANPDSPPPLRLGPAALLIAGILTLSVLAGPVLAYTTAAADQALDPENLVRAVLGGQR